MIPRSCSENATPPMRTGSVENGDSSVRGSFPQIRLARPLSPMSSPIVMITTVSGERRLHGPDQRQLDHRAAEERGRERERERRPVGQVLHQAPGDERGEHRHLALREVDDAG